MSGEDVILQYYNLSQVTFANAKLGSTNEGVFISQTFKNHVGKLTDHAVGDSITLHALAQELYDPEIRKELELLGVRADDEYLCDDRTQEHRFRNVRLKAIKAGHVQRLFEMKTIASIETALFDQSIELASAAGPFDCSYLSRFF